MLQWIAAAAFLTVAIEGTSWTWPEPSKKVKIDSKLRFNNKSDTQDDVNQALLPVVEPFETCSCTSIRECNKSVKPSIRCRTGNILCCSNRNLDIEVDGHGTSNLKKVLRPDNDRILNDDGFNSKSGILSGPEVGVLVGPVGISGNYGPFGKPDFYPNQNPGQVGPEVLTGPSGPSGNIGPQNLKNTNPGVLFGPNGSTGNIGPQNFNSIQGVRRNVLVGPEGPTGVIGPDFNNYPSNYNFQTDSQYTAKETAQRGILIGPGGPTGVVGPRPRQIYLTRGDMFNPRQRPFILAGPGGPTGIIGPYGVQKQRQNRHTGRILVGPGGPTGTIGPVRSIFVGPGGSTGKIGKYIDHDFVKQVFCCS